MTFHDALDAWVSVAEAKRELRKHGATGFVRDGHLYAFMDGEGRDDAEEVARIDANGDVLGGHVLEWLGY